jgi:predicted O-methyltransferase YrrM
MNKSQQVEKWYEENYKSKSGCRFDTFKMTLKCLYERVENPFIFETGTLRLENDFGAGYSTYIFGQCLSLFGGNLLTVDISPINMDTCKRITQEFSNNITYITDDSLNTIRNFEGKIDLLYLDSFDCPVEGDASESQKHNLNEFKLAEHKLHEKSLILIDDVNFSNGGKARLTHEYLENNGYKMLLINQQSLWTKNI